MLALIVQGELAMDAPRLSKASDKKKSARPPLPVSAPAPETEEEADAATVVKEYRRLKELARGSSSLTDPAVVKLMRFKEKHRSILQL